MRKIHFTRLSALALLATPMVLIAQDMPPPGNAMPPESSGSMDAPDDPGSGADLTPGQQAELATWPADVKSYYASLASDRQKAFWALSPEQRAQVAALPAEQQEQVWASIMQQLSTLQAGAGQTGDAQPSGMDDEAAPGRPPLAESPAATAPSHQAMNKSYPRCSKSVRDECRNRSGV